MPGPHLPIALHMKYRCVGVYLSFNFCVNCSIFEKHKIWHLTKMFHYMIIVIPLSNVSILVCVSCCVSRVLSLSHDQHGGYRQVSY